MDKDIIKTVVEDFKRCHDAESEQRRLSQDDLDFAILSKQWPQEVESQRAREGRPCLTINRMPAFLRQVTNDSRMNRPSINVKPAGSGASQYTARIQNDLIRNIWNCSSGDVCTDTALDFAASMGFGYMVVRVDYTYNDSFDQDIMLERVSNPFSIYGDPESKEATSCDWNLAFITDWYSESKFKAKWKDADASSFESDTKDELWFDEKRIRVAEYWTRSEVETTLLKLSDGKIMQEDEFLKIADLLSAQMIEVVGTRPTKTHKVMQRIVTGKEVLEENEWLGHYIPIIPMYGEEWNINGKRHFISLVRRAKDPQRMFNYWRTASTELVALAPKAPFIGAVGQFVTDAAKWETANVKSHPYIEYDPVPGAAAPERQAFAGVPAGALQEALNASDDMKAILGLYDASLGAKSNETSGKAILARQREGDTSTFNFIDNRNRCIEHVGRVIVDLIPQVYTVPRIMRAVKEDGTTYDVPVNQPVKVIPGQQSGDAEQFEPAPEHIEGLTQIFDLTSGKYDVVVTAGPSFTTRREESAEQMMEFIRVFPQAAPIIGDLLAKNLDWPGSEEVAKRLKAMLPPQAQSQITPIVQQLQQMLQQQDAQAKQAVGQLQQQIADLQKQINDKTRENAIKEYGEETKRISALVGAAEKGILLTRTAEGDMQAVPLIPPQIPQPGLANAGPSSFGDTPEQPPGM